MQLGDTLHGPLFWGFGSSTRQNQLQEQSRMEGSSHSAGPSAPLQSEGFHSRLSPAQLPQGASPKGGLQRAAPEGDARLVLLAQELNPRRRQAAFVSCATRQLLH